MIWKMLSAPVIGAVIGYCTNWLAVKMLFRPREEKHIGRFRVPFTPGVIPKGKKRLARAVGNVVNDQLLTEEVIQRRLLSPEILHSIKSAVNESAALLKNDSSKTLGALLAEAAAAADTADKKNTSKEVFPDAGIPADTASAESAGVPAPAAASADISGSLRALSDITVYEDTPEQRVRSAAKEAGDIIADHIYEQILAAGLGKKAAATANEKLGEALSGSILGQMMGGSVAQMIVPATENMVDSFIAENGREMIGHMVDKEIGNILETPVSVFIDKAEQSGIDPGEKTAQLYESAVRKKSGDLIRKLDLGGVIKDTIESMDNEELEDLVMSTMKTELRAVVSFGAVIGLVLGLINMLIYLL